MTAIYVISPRPAEGKTALCVGLAKYLMERGKKVGYMKPVRLADAGQQPDADAVFVREVLDLTTAASTLAPVALTASDLSKEASRGTALGEQVGAAFRQLAQGVDVMLLEGASGDSAADAAVVQISAALDAQVLLVCAYGFSLDQIRKAAAPHRERLLGVVLNQVPPERLGFVHETVAAALEREGYAVLAVVPEDPLLRAAPIGDLARFLGAEVLNSEDHLGELAEKVLVGPVFSDKVGEYFERWENKAVVTRSDRADLQLVALKTSTRCLVLTSSTSSPQAEGHRPQVYIAYQAQDKGLPILIAPQDTATTLDALGQAWQQVRFRQPQKVARIVELLEQHANLAPLEA